MAAAAPARGDAPPLEKARHAFEPFARFGTIRTHIDEDESVEFEIEQGDDLLIQAPVDSDGNLEAIWIYLEPNVLGEHPGTIVSAHAIAPHLEPVLVSYSINDHGRLLAQFEGELNHRTQQIAAFVDRLLGRKAAA